MADNANSGEATLAVNGGTMRLAGEFTYDPGYTDRETQKGQDGVHGQKKMPRVPFISFTGRNSSGLDVAALNDLEDADLYCQLVNGKSVTGRGMWQVGPTEVNTEEGTFSIRFEGGSGSVREGLA